MAEININGFSGMNNIKTCENFYSDPDAFVAEPRVILNSDVDLTGQLVMRKGRTIFIALAGAHSLWAGDSCMLCVAGGQLYRNVQGTAVQIGAVNGIVSPYSYVEAEEKVYISNSFWQGVFDPSSNSLLPWGVPLPPSPILLLGDGALPAGTYHVCMTNVVGDEISGSSGIETIELAATGGIQILNRPSGAIVWVTDADEYLFYKVGAVSKIVDIPTVEPLPSFLCVPPPYLENLCYAFGRIWGSSGNEVYYSQPFQLGWFKLTSNKFTFDSPVTMIAKTPAGLFVGMKDRTKYLAGTEPTQMVQSDAGSGSIKGTLAYCNNLPEFGWTLGTPEKSFMDVPVWLTTEGIVIGSPTGKYFNITKNKLKMGIPDQGASLYRNVEGVFQLLTSFTAGTTGSGAGYRDEDTYNAFKDGHLPTENLSLGGSTSQASFSDSATITVTRGGVLI